MMKKEYLISVIIPAYNAAKDLPLCIQKLQEQTYKNLEIIIVHDCGQDNTLDVAKELAKKDERIVVLENEKNMGCGMSRNHAMEIARGEYVAFLDADDYLDSHIFEECVGYLQEKEADVILFGMAEDYFDQNDQYSHSDYVAYDDYAYLEGEALRQFIISLEEKTLYGYACNKIYRLENLKKWKMAFRQIVTLEDAFFNIEYFQHAHSLIIVPGAPYHYIKKLNQSMTNLFYKDYFEIYTSKVIAIRNQYASWGLLSDEVNTALARIYMRYLTSAIQRNCEPQAKMNHKARKEWLIREYASENFNYFIPYAKSDNALVKIFLTLFKKKNVFLMLGLGRGVYLVRRYMPMVFAKIKKNR